MGKTAVLVAKLAGNMCYGACSCRFGRKTRKKTAHPGMGRLLKKRRPESIRPSKMIQKGSVPNCTVLEFCKVHVALFGQGFVQGKSFVQSVAGLTLLSNLEVIPHELLVVRVHAVLNDALGALGG